MIANLKLEDMDISKAIERQNHKEGMSFETLSNLVLQSSLPVPTNAVPD